MGNHYNCAACGQYLQYCRCPPAPPPPTPTGYVLQHFKPVLAEQVPFTERLWAARYETELDALSAAPGAVDARIIDFRQKIARLRKEKAEAIKRLQIAKRKG